MGSIKVKTESKYYHIEDARDLALMLLELERADGPEGWAVDIAITAQGELELSGYHSYASYWDLGDGACRIGTIDWTGGFFHEPEEDGIYLAKCAMIRFWDPADLSGAIDAAWIGWWQEDGKSWRELTYQEECNVI